MQKEGKKNDKKDDKTRWELMPLDCLEDIARVYTEGAKKYGENTWQYLDNGYERYKGALLRHLYAAEHDEFDEETGCRHLAQVAWNAIALLWLSKATDKYVFSKELSNAIAKEIGTTQSVNDFSTENISTKEGENKNITDSFEKTSVIEILRCLLNMVHYQFVEITKMKISFILLILLTILYSKMVVTTVAMIMKLK